MTIPTIKYCDKPLSNEDFARIEAELGVTLPSSLKRHYASHNGGTIAHAYIPGIFGSADKPMDLRFLSMLYDKKWRDDPAMVIPTRTKGEWEAETVPRNFIPFAFYDDYVCIDHETGAIYCFYRYGDKLPHRLCDSFDAFMSAIRLGRPPVRKILCVHPFWGEIVKNDAISSSNTFAIPFFETWNDEPKHVELGRSAKTPSPALLDGLAQTFSAFLDAMHSPDRVLLQNLMQTGFAYYEDCYAEYDENQESSGETPLGIDTAEKHFSFMNRILRIQVLPRATILLAIDYALDSEHGLEFKIKNNKVIGVGGIGNV